MTELIKTVTRQSKKAHKRILELLDEEHEDIEELAWVIHETVLAEYHAKPFYVVIVIHEGFPGVFGPCPNEGSAKKIAGHLVSLGFPNVKTAKTYSRFPQEAHELAELYGWNVEDAA